MNGPSTVGLAAQADAVGLNCVLIGGNAVNLYAYRRTTFDIDLLIREADRQRWINFFEARGFVVFHATQNFVRMRFGADPTQALPVDLMLADEKTFQKIFAARQERAVGDGLRLSIPSALHLIAMKLHALRSPHRVEDSLDLEDVRHLIKAERIDLSSVEFRDILDRYASEQIKDELLKGVGGSQDPRSEGTD